jgi:enolase-phosphatase E1
MLLNDIDAVLLDIEGTTTPVNYVFDILFPFAQQHVESFLLAHAEDLEVQGDLRILQQEYEEETKAAAAVPLWDGSSPVGAVPYIHYLIGLDRKSTGLKSLQGKIWEQGYREGKLRAQMFADVPAALQRWVQAGKQVCIYSSGSVQAQQLLFRYSEAGDLTPCLSGYFDTRTGPKREAESYRKIAAVINLPPDRICFISDVVAELEAAEAAGLRILLSLRPGNAPTDPGTMTVVYDFNGL